MTTVSGQYYNAFLAGCRTLYEPDVKVEPILPKTISYPPAPASRVGTAYLFELLKKVSEQSGEGDFTIKLSQIVSLTDYYGAKFGQAILYAANWRQALTIERRYQPLSQEFARINMIENKHTVKIFWECGFANPENGICGMELVIANHIRFAQWVSWDGNIPVRSISFRHADPGNGGIFGQHYSCEVLFNQDHDAIELDKNIIDMPLPQADPQMLATMCARLDKALASHYNAGPT
ncbi:MAG TPA: hypothetical protein ENJ42_08055, partial [Hellea balneolensis]|nr:hypothetical protein [Hellea balneolensis]